MRLGIGLYRHMLHTDYYRFAKQAGCEAVVVHLVNYYGDINDEGLPSTDGQRNYGVARLNDPIWEYENLVKLKEELNQEGLEFAAIENFNPSDWYDVLLAGPKRDEQIEQIKQIIRNVGRAGIPVIGYNFSIAGVWGHIQKPSARGGALTSTFHPDSNELNHPIPLGQVWNMTYDASLLDKGYLPPTSEQEIWDRLAYFLERVLPVAEEAGVKLALHPDDPPMPQIRQHARLVNEPDKYQKMIDLVPSQSNSIEFCMGSIQEMVSGDVYEAIDQYASQDKISYVHFRNVKGKVPHYTEVFVDEGDIDMLKALRVLKNHQFTGVLIPDHTPLMTCDAPWHAGMAYALGYMRAIMRQVEQE
ncbi:D-mannonate dehydratase [Paenibacillus odorifer]|uniref:mannonate dehydratase n=1 Tax=Paenibacillus odorifer TaxID=189426 RepID=A0A1R0ZB52_9BACL|nr:mannonate dehydratase [Paenibacillus odorifer]OME65839.1 D-mannonate dehydratase [Paenibacillus odorifer]